VTAAEREAIRQNLEAGEYASVYCDADEVIERLLAEIARLQGLLDRLGKLLATTMVEREWKAALQWRDRFLNEDDETLEPLDAQTVAFLIADAETLRALETEWCGAIPPSPQEPDK